MNHFYSFLFFSVIFTLMSCSNDDNVLKNVSHSTANMKILIKDSPCMENLTGMKKQGVISIDCVTDLRSRQIDIPENTTTGYEA